MIGDDIAAALPELRAEAESLMHDECRIERADGWTTDPDNGQRIKTWRPVAATPCRVVRVGTSNHREPAGGQTRDIAGLELRLPWSASDLQLGDRLTLTTSSDPRLLDAPITITEVSHATHAVARRIEGVLDEDRQQ